MRRTLLLGLVLLFSLDLISQLNYTANDVVAPYEGVFRPGSNLHFTQAGQLYTDEDLANIAAGNPSEGILGAGAKTIRPSLPNHFVEQWGYDIRLTAFQHYNNIGLGDLTCFVGYPKTDYRDTHISSGSNGAPCRSTLFANMYEPIWDGGANGTPYNDNNYYAKYLWDVVTMYTDYVKFWEIWNEPGRDFSNTAWRAPGDPWGEWWTQDPPPCDYELKAPIEHYVRLLRISYEIIKTISPEDYVAIAGVGSESFLDAILRNTDNPIDGSPTAAYPNGGGAYFDVMGFHSYPDIDGTVRGDWNPAINDFNWNRHSDRAAFGLERRKGLYQEILSKHGYDGATYPNKEWIVTEFNLPRENFSGNSIGNEDTQINYIVKTVVNAIKLDIRQIHIYSIYEDKTEDTANHEFDLLGLYKNINFHEPYQNLEMNKEGIAYKSSSLVLFGTRYDEAKTASLNLPSSIDGGAFVNSQGEYTYVLWAKTTQDRVESAFANYSFPSSFGLSTVYKKEWDFATTGAVNSVSASGINLTERPYFFTEDQTVSTPIVPFLSSDINEGCDPVNVNFTDLTTPSADSWFWTFPGGTPETSTEQNPSVTYNVAGDYDVILEVSNNGFTEAVTYEDYIHVDASPHALFSFSNANATSIIFNNQSTFSSYYFWDFGDGTSSQDFNPYHTYTESGTYTIALSSANDCTIDVFTLDIEIDVDDMGTGGGTFPPAASFSSSAQSGCAPMSIDFEDESTNAPTSWMWTFDGGNPLTSTDRNPTVTYSEAGTYSVILQAANAGGSDAEVQISYITIGDSPVADFSTNQTGNSVSFVNSTEDGLSYAWDFGDNNSSTLENPMHVYSADGTYTVIMVATNDCGTSTTMRTVSVNTGTTGGGQAPAAAFSTENSSTCAPSTVFFYDESTNAPTSWLWTFEGGTPETSTEENPTVVFENAGEYSVILQAGNASGSDMEVKLDHIVIDPRPTANFSFAVSSSNATFSNTSIEANTYSWDFGDGTTSNDVNPTHTYSEDGTFTVVLNATNPCGTEMYSQTIEIDNSSSVQAPAAGFEANILTGCSPLEVTFNDLSSNGPTAWSWSFEGGTPETSTEQNPTVVYSQSGTYTVILQASNAGGSDTEAEISYITVSDVPTADFTLTQINDSDVSFNNNSSSASSYSWNFGDGSNSTDADPSHSYTSGGTYTVVLTATNDCGSVEYSSTITINLTEAPAVSFNADVQSGCAPLTVQFQDDSTNEPSSWLWSFEGGNPATSTEQNPNVSFDNAGTYTVILQAGNSAGSNTSVRTEFIIVDDVPDAFFSLSQTDATITLFNTSGNANEYSWDFGDGTTSTDANPAHEYAAEGEYTISLTAINDCGSTTWTETITVEEVIVPLAPVAVFTSNQNSGCLPLTVEFTDQSTTGPTSWAWLFPGGTPASSNEQNPTVVYDEAGVYTVTLAVSNPYGNDINSQSNLIVVNDTPVAEFDADEDNGTVVFENNSLYGNSYIWDFGDGGTSTEENPTHTYETPGSYNVVLQVAGPCGFTNTVHTVVVDEITAIEDLDFVNEFNIFPNPNSGEFTISLQGEGKDKVEISFLNILGQTIQSGSYKFNSGELNEKFYLNDVSNGVYLVKISSGAQAQFHKLVIEE